jgi:hypothetical protein
MKSTTTTTKGATKMTTTTTKGATMTATEAKLKAWACAEIQHARGRGAIVMKEDAVLEPVSVRADMANPLSPVCRVSVPVILQSLKETVCHYHFTNHEIALICG